jgi:hypothetical protein
MKNLSRSDSRRAVSASSVFVAAVALSAAAPAVADIYMNNIVQRYATAAGLTDNYFEGSVGFSAGDTMISATRPNGQTNWPQQYGMWEITTPQGPPTHRCTNRFVDGFKRPRHVLVHVEHQWRYVPWYLSVLRELRPVLRRSDGHELLGAHPIVHCPVQ